MLSDVKVDTSAKFLIELISAFKLVLFTVSRPLKLKSIVMLKLNSTGF